MAPSFDRYQMKLLKRCFLFLLLISCNFISAQLSDLHYLPPLKQGQNNQGIRDQAIYLSTPEPTTFTVNAYRGTNPAPVASFNISNVSPAVWTLGDGDNNITLVNNANTGVVLTNSGLRFESPSGNRFYVNYRGNSNAQAASLTAKGRQALGTRFKWGGVPNLGAHSSKSNTLGIMATENNTTINVFGYDPGCEFRVGNNRAGITDNTYTITLNANESFVFETYIGNSPTQAHEDGWIGASIISDKDIVISNGSINFGRQVGASNRDAGIDQPVPENRLGKEYVFIRGNGNTNGWTEFPLLIATSDNTQIFVNGNPAPIATLNNGDYFEVPNSYYSANAVGANMFVQTSKDVYAYQCMAGASQVYTQGLNFVAPVNCLLPDVMDNIPDIRNMAGLNVTGGLTIIAAANTPDANIQVTDGNGAVTLPASNPVAGSTDWKTFFIPNLNGDVSVQSTGPMAVGFFGYNGARGVAGYFSGFDTLPEVTLAIRGGSGCFVGSEIYEATNNNFDAFQWYENGQPIPGANSPSYSPPGAGDYFLRGTKGPCTYDSNLIQALYCDPDVVLEKTVDKAEIMEGETVTFTIRVQNWGLGPLTNLQITDNIPTGLTLINAFTISGSWSGNTWNIGTLNGGEVAELELEVRGDEIDVLPLLSLTNTVTNTQDQTDTNITPDNPTALLTVHNDFDNDGINDITDLDDDNDGIYDEEECATLLFNISNGSSHNSDLISVDNYLVLDVFSIDNSFNLQINGNDVAGEIQFQDGASGNTANFIDGTGYGENGNPDIWTITGTHGSPLLRVIVDQAGEFRLFGTRSSNGPLEPMILTTPANIVNWNPSGNNDITIGQAVAGPTNMRGLLLTAGCDTDSDGFPDSLDLDSDDDGCSDANEYYKDNNADGGDGGEYGSGVPVVDPNDGTVNNATYIKVFAPEILLGNTSENLGGGEINGQGVNLGQTFQYVLSFQNTGDDNATNYVIRDILPNNVTLATVDVPENSIDVSDASGTTFNYDINTNTIEFQVPDNLVEVGDPEYSIKIIVRISANCSDFVDACSSQLENLAYSTFQGVLNPTVFTDEPGSSNFPCNSTPEVASNNILNNLASCNQTRTVELCGEDVLLAAGSGFGTYTWALDNNGNGQIDGSDTVLNDGDTDGDPSTLLVTDIGNYIVEKSGAGSCPDLTELITVERFGTTQTNPIIAYFNQVNSDGDLDNDLNGEIVACSLDGDLLPKIFLCGENDSALIQLGITDYQNIVWQKLDETSCSDNGDDCANKNFGCTWNDFATGNNFTVTDSGEYRVVITYQGGCFSRFYFNVFKNTLDIQHSPPSDILCSTPGNIRVTNIGAGYGFQLVNTENNSIAVPFSNNNGPNFDITDSGTYKVQVTQLDPLSGNPIDGACIFETDDIGILERDYQVNITTTPADCNTLGTIAIQALNVMPQYSYELRLDDGSNGGQGAFLYDHLLSDDNTHTFTEVSPGKYIVITTTVDGCTDTQKEIIVGEIPKLTLTAVTRENITCDPGIVNLTPGGGTPNPDYRMAVWSKDGMDLYPSPPSLSDIPPGSVQTASSFLFNAPMEAGDYEFVVFDDNGCHAISNVVPMEYLDSPSITASHSAIVCADDSTASLTVSVTGGTPPYQYSLDGGVNYQTADTFPNLSAGLYTITVMDSSGSGATGCVVSSDYEIDQPFRLTASAAIVEDTSCNPSGTLVKILNANGGQAPYEYSFDGGANYGPVNERNLLAGTHQLVVRDALKCTFNMDLTVPAQVSDPSLSYAVDYDCNGVGTITISTSNITDFDYTYSLNGTENIPSDNNIFTNVAAGTQTVTVGYSSSIAPNQSTLFFEDFGAGTTTQIGEIGPDYCYEPQDGSVTTCNRGPAGILVNGEYTVTNRVTNPVPFWTSPQDHTNLTDGRFLAIDVSNFSDTGNPQLNTILWARRDIEVLPNEEITLNFWAYNLMNLSGAGNNPEVLIEILDNTGALIYSEVAPEIPKNTNDTDWHERTISFDPGTNTDIDIVFRTNVNSNDGNDLILDDITAFQVPSVCPKTQDLAILVEADQAFDAQLLNVIDPSCNGVADGAIRFEVSNFDALAGFEYSLDGFNWNISYTSPVTTTTTLADGNYTVRVIKANETACLVDFPATITEPSAIVPTLGLTAEFTCSNTGATLEASATGGSPGYEYQLEDTLGNIVTSYQTGPVFPNITNGDYLVRVRDKNSCEVLLQSAMAVTVSLPQTITFTTSHTNCYDGQNNATISVQVTSGNGDYTFSINGGAPMSPSIATPTEYTFTNLGDGTYTIEVFDTYGCSASNTATPVIIDQVLLAQIDAVDVTDCADGSITVTPSGGDGNYVYAFLPTGSTVADSDFGATHTFTVTNATAGNYDVYVRDNNGSGTPDPYCQYMETVTVGNTPVLAFTTTPTDPECHDGLGSIDITITAGDAPFTIEIIDLDNGGASNQTVNNVLANDYTFFNLNPGDYTISVTDTHGCPMTDTPVSLNNPDELTASVIGETPSNCGGLPTDFGFDIIGYPITIGTVEFSDDAGATWQSSDQFRGYNSGQIVHPSLRTVDGSGNTICQTDLPQFIIPFPLDDLDINLSALVVNCDELQVVVQGSRGVAPYQYAFSDDPANFDPATATWFPGESTHKDGSPVLAGHGRYEWLGLVPGRTYVFYVQDNNNCTRQSNVNVNDLITQPLGITSSLTPSCNGNNNGSITYTIVENIVSPGTEMQWSFYNISTGTPVLVSDSGGNVPFSAPQTLTFNTLGTGNYFLEVTKMDGAISSCVSASENELLEELDAITGTPGMLRDIACNRPGLIEIPDISGGGGTYYYDVTGPAPFAPITGTLDNPIEVPANSPSGSYAVSVTDQYGCSTPLGNVNLNLSPNPDIHNIEVNNCGPQASITVTSFSAAPIHYSIDNGAGYTASNNTGLFTNVPLGTYTATILDGNGCGDTDTVTVHPSLQANASLEQILGCGAGHEAEILVEATNGSGNYEYEIVGTSSTLISRQALAVNPTTVPVSTADTYTVHIYDIGVDGPECSRTFTVVIDPALVPSISVDAFTDATCNGANDGTLTVTATNLVAGTHVIEIVSGTGAVLSTFPISAPNGGNTVTFQNLEATGSGINYTVRVTSPNGCFAETTQVISEPDAITVNTIDPIPYECSSGNTFGNASLTFAGASGGSGNYVRYEFIRDGNLVQDGTNPTWIETDFAGGSYLINVYDENGCMGSTSPTIVPFDEMATPTIHVSQKISCAITNKGEEIRIDVTGSITDSATDLGNYQFTVLSSGTYAQDAIDENIFTELQPGTHTFAVRNIATECEIIVNHVVEEPNTFDVTVEKLSDVVCSGTDGSIRLTLVDATYSGGFSWRIFDTNGNLQEGPRDWTDLGPTDPIAVPAGNYLVEVVQDALPKCSQVRSFSIATPSAPITLSPIDLTNVGCSNHQGSALIAPTGGQGPYTIALTHVGSGTTTEETSVSSHLFQGLSDGDYNVSITDALTCNRVFNSAFNLALPSPITGTISNTTLVCQGDTNASVSISPGNINYRYVLNTYSDAAGGTLLSTSVSQDDRTFTNLGAGFYSIEITDDFGCTETSSIVEIENPVDVQAQLFTHQALSCQMDTELLLVASGGTGPYEWSEDNSNFIPMNNVQGAGTHLFTNVASGNDYQYYIRDSFNCISIISNEVSVDPFADLSVPLDTSAANINCNGDATAAIRANANGGLGNYEYALFDADSNTEILPNQPNGLFTDLSAGNYYVRVQSGDCEAISQIVPIAEPEPLVVDPIISEISCADSNDGSILLEVTGGSGVYQFAISPNLNQFDDKNSFDELAPGDYTIIVQDKNGCIELVEFSLIPPDTLAVTSTVSDEICYQSNDGTITLEITGGTAPYYTSLNSNEDADFAQDVLDYSGLPSGNHMVYIKDANGCEITEVFQVQSGVNLAGEAVVQYECDPQGSTSNSVQILFEDPSISNEVLYGLDTDEPLDMQLEPVFENLIGGSHIITVVHSNGCSTTFPFEVTIFDRLELQLSEGDINQISAEALGGSGNYTFIFNDEPPTTDQAYYIRETGTYTVTVTDENGCSISQEIFMEFIDIEIPNFFTPDGDGNNDSWAPRNIEQYPNIFIKIFDRYGRNIFQFQGNQDSWDGQYKFNGLPTGDYWYIIKLNGIEDEREFVGNFTLYR